MGKPLRVLFVEDSKEDVLLIERELNHGGYVLDSRTVSSRIDLEDALHSRLWDVILCDHNMPELDSGKVIEIVHRVQPDVPLLIVSGSLPEEAAAHSMRLGAQDYVCKDNLARLVPAIDRELRDAVTRRKGRQAELSLQAQTEELRIGREIQQRLFPSTSPIMPGFELSGASFPATSTGGDYFDYIPMKDGLMGLVVGDVTGHGIGPALIMADARAYLRSLCRTYSDVSEILLHANELLRPDLGEDRFVTAIFASLQPVSHVLSYLNAGHTCGFLLDRRGVVKERLESRMPALGLMAMESTPAPNTLRLAAGELLLFLTDGVIEASGPDGEEFGEDRVLAVVRKSLHHHARDIVEAIRAAVMEFAPGQPQQDDITALVVKVRH